MTTKDITEGILYLTNNEAMSMFRASHIIDDKARNWQAREHKEFPCLNDFYDPKFIVIISTQIHIFIFGTYTKNRNINVLNVEGYNVTHCTLNKGTFFDRIKEIMADREYLPTPYIERIIAMNMKGETYVFNKMEVRKNFFTKSYWSVGVDYYDVAKIQTKQKYTATDVLNELYEDFL